MWCQNFKYWHLTLSRYMGHDIWLLVYLLYISCYWSQSVKHVHKFSACITFGKKRLTFVWIILVTFDLHMSYYHKLWISDIWSLFVLWSYILKSYQLFWPWPYKTRKLNNLTQNVQKVPFWSLCIGHSYKEGNSNITSLDVFC